MRSVIFKNIPSEILAAYRVSEEPSFGEPCDGGLTPRTASSTQNVLATSCLSTRRL